jgi:hypothetical protein
MHSRNARMRHPVLPVRFASATTLSSALNLLAGLASTTPRGSFNRAPRNRPICPMQLRLGLLAVAVMAVGCSNDLNGEDNNDTGVPEGPWDDPDFGCADGDILRYDEAETVWFCDLDNNTQVGEGEVDAFVANNGFVFRNQLAEVAFTGSYNDLIDLPVPSQAIGGVTCQDGEHLAYSTTASEWVCAQLPPDQVLTEGDVDNYVLNNGYVEQQDLATVAFTGDYADLLNVPPDADTLAALSVSCLDGQVAVWNNAATAWECGDAMDADALAAAVEGLVLDLAPGTTMGGAPLAAIGLLSATMSDDGAALNYADGFTYSPHFRFPTPTGATTAASSGGRLCFLLSDGEVDCRTMTGAPESTRLGLTTQELLVGRHVQLDAAGTWMCGLAATGEIRCVDQTGALSLMPTLASDFQMLGSSDWCWVRQSNNHIQCSGQYLPESPLSGQFRKVRGSGSSGAYIVCGLTLAGSIQCADNINPPMSIPSGTFVDFDVRYPRTICGILEGGAVKCGDGNWGMGADALPGPYDSITSGSYGTCVWNSATGSHACWGERIDEITK